MFYQQHFKLLLEWQPVKTFLIKEFRRRENTQKSLLRTHNTNGVFSNMLHHEEYVQKQLSVKRLIPHWKQQQKVDGIIKLLFGEWQLNNAACIDGRLSILQI